MKSITSQKGFATLLSSLMLMFVLSFFVFMGARGSVIEQKTAINGIQAEGFFEYAEKGLAEMLAKVKVGTTSTISTSTYVATITSVSGGSANDFIITSKALGSDGLTKRIITQRVTVTPAVPPIIPVPVTDALTTLGSVSVGGNTSVSSVKAGGSITTSGSGTVGAVTTSDFTQKTVVNGVETTLLGVDGRTIKLTEDEYFLYYFSNLCPSTKTRYDLLRATSTVTSVALAQEADGCKPEAKVVIAARTDGYICSTDCSNANLSAQYTAGKRLLWLTQGGMRINANVTLGSATDPVIVFVMESGTVQINGTAKIYGVVYVDVPKISSTVTNITSTASGICVARATRLSNNNPKWSSVSYAPATGQITEVTVAACQAATNKCTPTMSNDSVTVGTVSTCNYNISVSIGTSSTTEQTQVIIEVLGTWSNSGGGNALIEGAAITSGNFTTTGGIELVKNTGVTEKFTEGTDASVTLVPNGWSDMSKE